MERDPALAAYLDEISRFPVLSRQEELELAHRARAGDEVATKRLIEANLRFVVKIAHRYANQGLPLADLISAGNEGLIIAVRHFEPERGIRLISYGVWWIKQSISRVLANDSRTIRLPFYVYCDLYRVSRVREVFQSRHGRQPTIDELSDETGIKLEKLERIARLAERQLSLNRPVVPDEGTEMVDLLTDSHFESPERFLIAEDRHRELVDLLSKLPKRQRRIVEMHYGIGRKPMTLRQIGEVFDLSRERVRQIEVSAFRRIRREASTSLCDG
jgi:RNA polymerase primary sigma factor